MKTKKTPLFEQHNKLGAKCAPFGGWLMPIQYEGIISEHQWTRNNCSVFDICHMGEFLIKADALPSKLDKILTQNLVNMPLKTCRYGFMLNDNAGIIDDVIIYRIEQDKWMLVVNAATSSADFEHLEKNLAKDNVKIEDISNTLAKLDLQGPLSRDVLVEIAGEGILKLDYYTFDYFKVLGENIIISRTGYTGELGFELYISNDKVIALWNLLLKNKTVKPAGLGARDTLRLEVCYPLYGQDINSTTTPLEAGLAGFVDMNKDFSGKKALGKKQEQGLVKKLCCFETDSRRAPRHDYEIFSNNRKVGVVTSGSYSPSLGCGIGMGYIETQFSDIGTEIILQHENVKINAKVVKRPFYKKGSLRI
ncbi:MAG: glycine cleavage system aminomethyltransferase GcvT [Candidatus Omnitrophota bacterium]